MQYAHLVVYNINISITFELHYLVSCKVEVQDIGDCGQVIYVSFYITLYLSPSSLF